MIYFFGLLFFFGGSDHPAMVSDFSGDKSTQIPKEWTGGESCRFRGVAAGIQKVVFGHWIHRILSPYERLNQLLSICGSKQGNSSYFSLRPPLPARK
jgi:hypothetical protein